MACLCLSCWIQPARLQQLLLVAPAAAEAVVGQTQTNSSRHTQQKIAAIRADHQAACQNVPESVDAFVRDVANRTEEQSLTRWERNSNHWIFPQLDRDLLESALGGKRVALIGDSTMFYLMQWLHQLLNVLPDDFVQTMAARYHHSQTSAFRAVEAHLKATPYGGIQYTEDFKFERRNHPNHQDTSDCDNTTTNAAAHILWKAFNGGTMRHNCEFDTLVWPQVLQHQPDIIVANWGLHMLFRPKVQECNVRQFVDYESFFLERTLQTALEANTRIVLFKTTNRMCKDEAATLAKHAVICHRTLLQDPRHYDSFVHHFGLNDTQLKRYCDEAAFVEASAQRLNHRLATFVVSAQQNPRYANMTIAIYKDHDLESCDYTQWNDGVHYQLLAFPRLRLLAHMIHCLWKDDDEVLS